MLSPCCASTLAMIFEGARLTVKSYPAYTYSTTRQISTGFTVGGNLGLNFFKLTASLGSIGFTGSYTEIVTTGNTGGISGQCGAGNTGAGGAPGNWCKYMFHTSIGLVRQSVGVRELTQINPTACSVDIKPKCYGKSSMLSSDLVCC